jgi:ATP-dependent DNA helicase DinG
MALEVARAFEHQDIAIVEAGTGTGKTLAYIVPALLSGRKTIVSTGTKNLQEQIFHKDIPFIRKHIGSGFKAAVLKGRENYLCAIKYKSFLLEPTFVSPHEAVFIDALTKWARETKTGDRAELTELPEDFQTWSDISASADHCLGSKCPEAAQCFLWKARRTAAAADLVVVNHHLFMADLAVKGGGYGEVIPEYEAAIFDEAHQLEDVATQYFGISVSSWRLALLKRDVEKELIRAKKLQPQFTSALALLAYQAEQLAGQFFSREEEIELWKDDHPVMDQLRLFGGEVVTNLENLAAHLEQQVKDEELVGLGQRTREISAELTKVLEASDFKYVYWAEKRGRGLFLRASPVDVSPFLQEGLYAQGATLVFTSATLTTARSFDYFKERLGLLPEIDGLVVESPFDMARQSMLYVPRSFPFPQSPDYQDALVDEINCLLKLSRGRAFVLFTSYRNLNHVAKSLAGKLPWPCLIQGEAPRHVLLETFKKKTESVLLATHSFWQGVDVPGESLSAVIIDKLPFPLPTRPLIQARADRLREAGQDPFFSYFVPGAIITLKQGLGRLIRTASDRGLLAVLDSRLLKKGYGKKFLESLPAAALVHEHSEVAHFFADREQG